MLLSTEMLSAPELSAEAFDYLTMLYGLACEKICVLFCNNVAHFYKLMEKLNRELEQYINDIRQGTISVELPEELEKQLAKTWEPNPARSDKLEEILNGNGMLKVEGIWPEFDFVGCWLSASVGCTAKEFA